MKKHFFTKYEYLRETDANESCKHHWSVSDSSVESGEMKSAVKCFPNAPQSGFINDHFLCQSFFSVFSIKNTVINTQCGIISHMFKGMILCFSLNS